MRPTHPDSRLALRALRSVFRRPAVAAIIALTIMVVVVFIVQAASATWNSSPTDGNWVTNGTENNWSGGIGTFPGSTSGITNTDTATFLTSSNPAIIVNSTTLNIKSVTIGVSGGEPATFTIGSTSGNSLLLSSGGTISIPSGTSVGVGHIETIDAPLVLEPPSATTAGAYTLSNAAASANLALKLNGVISGGTTTQGITLTLQGGNLSTNNIAAGVISDGGAAGGIALIKSANGTWALAGANTFTGGVTINAGILKAGSTTALGPAASAKLTFGASSTGKFQLSGNNTTLINLNTNATVGSPIVENGLAGTATLTDHTIGADTYAGVLQNGTGTLALTKSGAGTLTLAGANTYTGTTTISAGTLTCGAANVLPGASTVSLSGGALRTGPTTGNTQSTGTLAVTDDSTIALGTGVHSLTFAASNGVSWTSGKRLIINGWTGGFNGTSGTAGKVFVGSTSSGLTTGQLSQISFYDGASHLYPATILSTGEVVPLSSPTAVNLTSFTATRNGSDVLIQWQSGYEVRNLGYNVYRERNGRRTLITPSLVAGSALAAGRQTALTAGFSYSWLDQIEQRPEVGGRSSEVIYWLEDVDLNGARTWHGPIAAAEGKAQGEKREGQNAEGTGRSQMLSEVRGTRSDAGVLISGWPSAGLGSMNRAPAAANPNKSQLQAASVPTQAEIAATPGVKIAVSKAGWYRIAQPALKAAGLDANINAGRLQLFANGQEVPIKVSGNGVQLTSSDYIEFYGQGVVSTTDTEQTYYLLAGQSAGKRIGTVVDNDPWPPPTGPPSFDYTVERKERMLYFSGLLNGDAENFFGQIISSTPVTSVVPITHLQAGGTSAQLELTLQGATAGSHTAQVLFNGTDIGTVNFANTDHSVQTLNVPAAALVEGNNSVQLSALGGGGDVSLLDTLRLTYPHTYVAESNVLAIGLNSAGTWRVDGFTSANVRAIDITDPANLQELTPVVTVQPDGTYMADVRLAGASAGQPHTLLVFADAAAASPDTITYNNPSNWNLDTNAADYLVITNKTFVNSAQSLAQFHHRKGMAVDVIDVEDLFDEFSFGLHTPRAIHDFLQTAMKVWTRKPHYVVFLGDSSYDPKNYFGKGLNDLVPTRLIDTSVVETASDDWLADFDGDGVADLAIGRLPARSSADANTMVNKIINYESTPNDPQRGALLVADNSFEAASAALQSILPASMTKEVLNRSDNTDAATHAQVVSGINQGPLVVNYFGHGSNGVWTSAPLLSNLDAPALTNTNRLSLFTMMTCYNGYFQDAINDSLSEALLKSTGGAVAVWASTSLTEPGGQGAIDQNLYQQLFSSSSPMLGDAVRAAKLTISDSDVRQTWTLFGDPAMQVRAITPTASNGTIAGAIVDSQGGPLAGVTISLSGQQTRQTITDANGKYTFDGVETNAFYTITPARANYTFDPANRSFSLLGNHTEASFTATVDSVARLNPLDTTDFMVRQQYLDFLGREPDPSGLAFWTNEINSCGSDAQCVEVKRINVSAAFYLSIEFQQTGYLVYRTYKAAYGNMPNAPVPLKLNEFLPDTREIGAGVVVNQTGWEALLNNNKEAFLAEFVRRARFASAYPTTLTPAEFVERLFANASVTPATADRSAAIDEFGSSATSADESARARALRRVTENPALAQQEFNRAFVLIEYFGYLRRDANSGPDSDFSGYNFWLDKLNRFNGNFVNAEMVKAFLSSGEYRGRFQP